MKFINVDKITKLINDLYNKIKDEFASKSDVEAGLGEKADSGHLHDDRYFTESEINAKVNTINTAIGTAKTEAIEDANAYTDAEVAKKANVSHGTHVTYGGNGSAATVSRSDHNHDAAYVAAGTFTETVTELEELIDGKSASGHTHNYAGSSSAGGSANSAVKLANARTLTIGSKGKTFDGSANVSWTLDEIGAAASGHTHDGRYYTETEIDTKINTINTAIGTAKNEANSYTDEQIAALVNSAPDDLNTLNELAGAINDHQEVYDAYVTTVNNALAGKANASHGNHVPATQTADNKVFLRNDNTWATITPANIGASATGHTHDDRYFTETEITTKLNTINTSISTAKSEAIAAAKSYTDTGLAGKSDSSHKHSYLPLSGGTIGSANFGPLVIDRTGSTNGASISFKNTNGVLGYIGMVGAVNTGLQRWTADSATSYIILDTGNFKTHVTPAAIGASASGHNHDTAYYKKTEIDTKVSTINTAIGTAKSEAIADAKSYTDTEVAKKANVSHGNHVPTPQTANNAKFLRNDNTWQTVTPANIGAAAASHGTHVTYGGNGSATTVSRSDHNHDDRYFTETEMNTKINTINTSISTAKSEAIAAAKDYTDANALPVLVGPDGKTYIITINADFDLELVEKA